MEATAIYPDSYYRAGLDRWNKYYMGICEAVAQKSACLSRQIGSLIVLNNSIISTGYNGPPRGIPHCSDRLMGIDQLDPLYNKTLVLPDEPTCPRKLLGFKSGEGLEYCIAAHAERNCIANAARSGVKTFDGTLYLNTVLPCKDCMTSIINSGIKAIVCYEGEYDSLSLWMAKKANLKILRYQP